jgi:hypothetical protein
MVQYYTRYSIKYPPFPADRIINLPYSRRGRFAAQNMGQADDLKRRSASNRADGSFATCHVAKRLNTYPATEAGWRDQAFVGSMHRSFILRVARHEWRPGPLQAAWSWPKQTA